MIFPHSEDKVAKLNTIQAKARAGYISALSKRPDGESWIRFLSETLKNLPGDTVKTAFTNAIAARANLPDTRLIDSHAYFSVIHCPEESAICGRPIYLPMLEFKNIQAYAALTTKMQISVPQGFASFFDACELALGLPHSETKKIRNIGIFTCCSQTIPGSLGLDQIKSHEKKHCIDPLLHHRINPESLIITELAAVVGEFAGKGLIDESAILDAPAGFWSVYLNKIVSQQNGSLSQEILEVFKPFMGDSELTISNLAHGMTKYFAEITKVESNSILTTQFMNCRSSSELLELSKKLLPKKYETASSSQNTDTKQLIEEARPLLEKMMYYYSNWRTAYQITPRSISSLWQRKQFADQAMLPFLNKNSALGLIALQVLTQQFNLQFDTTNFKEFTIASNPEGPDWSITVSW